MNNPWDADEIIQPAPKAAAAPWDDDPLVEEEGLEIDIVGGTPVAADELEASFKPSRPSLFRMDSDFKERSGVSGMEMLGAAAKDMFGSREGAAQYLADKSGGKMGNDASGEPVLSMPDGTTYRLNDPGIDWTDVANVAGNVAAFWTPAAWAARLAKAKQVGLMGRSGLQALAGGSTDIALQATANGGEVDPVRTAASTVGAGVGEIIGTAATAGMRASGTAIKKATGQYATKAANLLRENGIIPTESAINQMVARIPDLEAGANPNALLGAQKYGFTYTQGQRATDPVQQFALLSREELLKQSPGGGQVLRNAFNDNTAKLDDAVSGITNKLGGGTVSTPAEMATAAAGRLQTQAKALDEQVSDAYTKAGQGNRTAINIEAVRGLPQMLRTSVADFAPNADTTPVAARTLQQIEAATKALLTKGQTGEKVAGVTLKALETQRRILNNNINAATNNADRAAMVKIKREFDGWMDEAVDTALISGDPSALNVIKEARALRAEFGRRFEGTKDTDNFISGLLDGSRTPEELVNIALGAGQVSKAASARFIGRLKIAAGDDTAVIDHLRAAHFMRITRGANGEPMAIGQIIRNIRQSEYNNASIVKALYSPQQWSEIKGLANSLDPLVAKGDFAKSSGTGERMMRVMFQKMGGGLPIVGEMVKGVGEGVNVVRAQAALRKPLKLPNASKPIVPAIGAGVGNEAR